MTQPNPQANKTVEQIFSTLNGSGAHACYCERSTDGGCKCALKDEYIAEAVQSIHQLLEEARLDELSRLDKQFEAFRPDIVKELDTKDLISVRDHGYGTACKQIRQNIKNRKATIQANLASKDKS